MEDHGRVTSPPLGGAGGAGGAAAAAGIKDLLTAAA